MILGNTVSVKLSKMYRQPKVTWEDYIYVFVTGDHENLMKGRISGESGEIWWRNQCKNSDEKTQYWVGPASPLTSKERTNH